MYLLVLFFPLIGAVLTGCFGRKIGERGAGILTSSCLVFSLSYSFLIAIEVLFNSTTTLLRKRNGSTNSNGLFKVQTVISWM